MTKVSPRSPFLRALRISVWALLAGVVVRLYCYLAWDWPLTSAETIVNVFIGCAVAFWFAWDSKDGGTGTAKTR